MKFNDLSIQEKAAVIKLGVGGGLHTLLEIQLFYDGLDSPDDPPTREEYLARRAAEELIKYYLEGSRNRLLSYPLYGKLNDDKKLALEYVVKQGNKGLLDTVKGFSDMSGIPIATAFDYLENGKYPKDWNGKYEYWYNTYNDYKKQINNAEFDLNENKESLANCLATATSNNPNPGHFAIGNKTFKNTHKEKGFKEVSKDEIEPGGFILLGEPSHAVILDSREGDNMYVNYSPGFFPDYKKHVNLNVFSDPQWNNRYYYNFVGNHADSVRWNNEYDLLYGNEYKKGGSIHIKPENRGKFNATKRRTGKNTEELTHSKNPLTRKRAIFALNARKWHHKHPDGGSLFDKWRRYMQDNTIDIPITFRLPEVTVTAEAPKPGSANYDRYIANTYDAWQRGDIDINTLPTETRNRVRGYSGTIAALNGMNTAAKVAGMTAAVPLGIIGGISSIPYLYNSVTNPIGLKLIKQLLASEIGGRSVDLSSQAITGKSWNENIGNLTYDITGWNPNNSMLGLIAVSFTNPGYMGWDGAKALGKSIAYGINNKIDDLSFKYGVNKLVENTEYPTHQFDNWTNYRSNVRTRKVIDKVLRDNPNLPYELKQQLRYAAKNMAYTNNADFHTYQPINDKLEGSDLPGLFYDDNTTRLYEISVPKYDKWSNTHEIGHIVDDVAPGKFSSRHGVIPEYMYDASGQENKVELFADIFANIYSERKPYDYFTHKPGLAENLKNRVDITKGYKFDEGFQNIIDKETGKVLNNPYPNRYLSQQLNITNPKAKIIHTLDKATHALYDNKDFPVLIKPLAEGADIEKLLSKTGTISRNSLEAYIKKQGKFYLDIMNDVVNSDFSDIDKINYNDFKSAISKKLPEYYRSRQTLFEDYGVNRLGFNNPLDEVSLWNDLSVFDYGMRHNIILERYNIEGSFPNYEFYDKQTGLEVDYTEIANFVRNNTDFTSDYPNLSTFTFESPGITGNTKHYGGNPIGHSRTYTTKEEPEILHVMESLSDWALNHSNIYPTRQEYLEGLNELINNPFLQTEGSIEKQKNLVLTAPFKKHMVENYTSRQILENLKFAALRGLKKMRYPTRETAAKIEGYDSNELLLKGFMYFDNNGNEISPREAVELNSAGSYRLSNLKKLRKDYEKWLSELESVENPSSKDIETLNEALFDIDNQINELYIDSKYSQPKSGIQSKKKYIYLIETILKKYSDFPKQYRKLFKDADVRTITDPKGNTWYEVDVPENYRKRKAEILMNLAPYLGLGLSSAALNKKKALGGPIKPFSYLPIPEVRY